VSFLDLELVRLEPAGFPVSKLYVKHRANYCLFQSLRAARSFDRGNSITVVGQILREMARQI